MTKRPTTQESFAWIKSTGAPEPSIFPSIKIEGTGRDMVETLEQDGISFQFDRSLTLFFETLRALGKREIKKLAISWGYEVPDSIMNGRYEHDVKLLVYGTLQNYWFMEVRGEIPSAIVTHFTDRVAGYKRLLTRYHKNPKDFEVSAKSKERLASTHDDVFYEPLDPQKAEKLKGQAALVFNAIKAGCATLAGITDHVDSSGQLKTKQPTERVVRFYLNEFRHKKIIIQGSKPFDKKGGKE